MRLAGFLLVMFLLGFLQPAMANSVWLCETDCGTVRQESTPVDVFVLSRPYYQGGKVFGEGNSLSAAYDNMKGKCEFLLHDGFLDYRPGSRISLRTNFPVTKVCGILRH